ncbi:hypothetical protein [Thalassovita taeanensis]|uniref:Type IV pilus biogenesis n=1 Tax=Thalassovita taeanensis TaxID=657014 RepID=A0A1H9KJE9_9RHOB|nr:hypothetical protein [Thalassovita taeanensis]SEQ99276.1 hypothetical protein SAMN04488092_1198 [Thalassovita taeanensis]
MKPNFALTLSAEGIGLLHRVPSGWHVVGKVGFGAPDLTTILAELYGFALRLEPKGVISKVVIPNEQIKYLSVTVQSSDPAQQEVQAQQALDGATPYAVGDLAYDWSVEDGQLLIAAVARETLLEAEAFARDHRFNPVSFVATPDAGSFLGEPFFGTAPCAEMEADSSGAILRDLQPIRVIGTAEIPPEPAPELPAAPAPGSASNPDISGAPDILNASEAGQHPDASPSTAKPIVIVAPPADPPAAPAFSSVRATRGTKNSDKRGRKKHLTGAARYSDTPSAPKIPVETPQPLATSPSPPSPTLGSETAIAESGHDAHADVLLKSAASLRPDDPSGEAVVPERTSFFSRAQRNAASPAVPAQSAAARVPAVQSERQRMTIFGARTPDADAALVGGKPRFLGLILTAALLLFLAAVAAWAAMFSQDGLAGLFQHRDTVAVSDLRDPTSEELAEEADAAAVPEDEVQMASLALDSDASDPAETSAPPEVLAQPQLAPPLTAEEVEARYAATGIWQMAPDQPSPPDQTGLDDLYVASIDHPVLAVDAVALPDPRAALSDAPPRGQTSPVAVGTVFDTDQRGLVKATPEGAVTPEGVIVYAGKPALLPPPTPTRFAETPQSAPERARLAAFRPKPRPGDLIEQTERTQLGGRSRLELAKLRPRLRPETEKQAAEADETPTEQAVAASIKPKARPGNFEQIVKRAEKAEVTQAAATLAPRSVKPSIPSSASVARQATVTNALNLRKVNLIGVYGKPASRRALVRLSNGRYKKVQIGDSIDGGKVAAIGETELRYVKSGRSIVLTMPRG